MKNKWDKRLHTPLHTPSLYLTTVTGMRNAIRIAMPLFVQRYRDGVCNGVCSLLFHLLKCCELAIMHAFTSNWEVRGRVFKRVCVCAVRFSGGGQ